QRHLSPLIGRRQRRVGAVEDRADADRLGGAGRGDRVDLLLALVPAVLLSQGGGQTGADDDDGHGDVVEPACTEEEGIATQPASSGMSSMDTSPMRKSRRARKSRR